MLAVSDWSMFKFNTFKVSEERMLVLMKRETGANPVRTRHCDKGVAANKSLILIGKACRLR